MLSSLLKNELTTARKKKNRKFFAPLFVFFFEEAGGSFVTLDHEYYFGMYKQSSLALLLFPLSLFLFFFVSLCQISQLKSKFKAYLINRHSVFVWLCVCVPRLSMIRRERVRESCTMTEGLRSSEISRGSPLGDIFLLVKQTAENPRARSRDISDSEHVGFVHDELQYFRSCSCSPTISPTAEIHSVFFSKLPRFLRAESFR